MENVKTFSIKAYANPERIDLNYKPLSVVEPKLPSHNLTGYFEQQGLYSEIQ